MKKHKGEWAYGIYPSGLAWAMWRCSLDGDSFSVSHGDGAAVEVRLFSCEPQCPALLGEIKKAIPQAHEDAKEKKRSDEERAAFDEKRKAWRCP